MRYSAPIRTIDALDLPIRREWYVFAVSTAAAALFSRAFTPGCFDSFSVITRTFATASWACLPRRASVDRGIGGPLSDQHSTEWPSSVRTVMWRNPRLWSERSAGPVAENNQTLSRLRQRSVSCDPMLSGLVRLFGALPQVRGTWRNGPEGIACRRRLQLAFQSSDRLLIRSDEITIDPAHLRSEVVNQILCGDMRRNGAHATGPVSTSSLHFAERHPRQPRAWRPRPTTATSTRHTTTIVSAARRSTRREKSSPTSPIATAPPGTNQNTQVVCGVEGRQESPRPPRAERREEAETEQMRSTPTPQRRETHTDRTPVSGEEVPPPEPVACRLLPCHGAETEREKGLIASIARSTGQLSRKVVLECHRSPPLPRWRLPSSPISCECHLAAECRP